MFPPTWRKVSFCWLEMQYHPTLLYVRPRSVHHPPPFARKLPKRFVEWAVSGWFFHWGKFWEFSHLNVVIIFHVILIDILGIALEVRQWHWATLCDVFSTFFDTSFFQSSATTFCLLLLNNNKKSMLNSWIYCADWCNKSTTIWACRSSHGLSDLCFSKSHLR